MQPEPIPAVQESFEIFYSWSEDFGLKLVVFKAFLQQEVDDHADNLSDTSEESDDE